MEGNPIVAKFDGIFYICVEPILKSSSNVIFIFFLSSERCGTGSRQTGSQKDGSSAESAVNAPGVDGVAHRTRRVSE